MESVSRAVSNEIPRAISGALFEAILKVKIEIGLRKVEKMFSSLEMNGKCVGECSGIVKKTRVVCSNRLS